MVAGVVLGVEAIRGGLMRRFEGKNVLITGAAGGIGSAIVAGFLREGAAVVAFGVTPAALERLALDCGQPPQLRTAIVDLRDPAAIKKAVLNTIEASGHLDVLVNCAGIAPMVPVLEISVEQWNDVIAVNLSGAFFMSQTAARHMVDRGGGSIVNIASLDAFVAESPYADYNASKAGLVQLTRSMAFELGHLGVRCNGVAPGFTVTPMMDYALVDEAYAQHMGLNPMRRPATPEEQAKVVLFLASDDSSDINGETIRVDGGTMQGFWSDPRLAPPVSPRPERHGA
jgi:NAD(P)-dependent dehydrogenase (short-subunit alcohol dehydrogenase family)